MHELAVVAQGADDGVLFHQPRKIRLPLHLVQVTLHQPTEGAQPPGFMLQSDAAGPVQLLMRMLLGQTQEALQHPHTRDPPRLNHGLGPALGLQADAAGLFQELHRPSFHRADLLIQDVPVLGAELAGILADVRGD